MAEKPKVLTTTKARGGVGTHTVRYVLVISTVLAIAAMAWAFLAAPTANQPASAQAGTNAAPPATD